LNFARLQDFAGGLDPWIQVYCLLLVGVFAASVPPMLWQYGRARWDLRKARKWLRATPASSPAERHNGRTLADWDVLRENGNALPRRLRAWWHDIESAVARYESPSGTEGYFVTDPISADNTSETIIARYYSVGSHSLLPPVLTSLGLLGTFIAILMGLKGLHVDPVTHAVQGIELLISSLSGKFATSIVALALSVAHVLINQLVLQSDLRRVAGRIAAQLAERIPYLAPTRVLIDIQAAALKQTAAISNISADVVGRFATVFRDDLSGAFAKGVSDSMAETLGPPLSDVSARMGEMVALQQAAQQDRGDAMVEHIGRLTQSLGASIEASLGRMSGEFQRALSGSAQNEFQELGAAIQGTATLLRDMSTHFGQVQAQLQVVIESSRSSTQEQMAAATQQMQRLTHLMDALLTNLNDSAAATFEHVAEKLDKSVASLGVQLTAMTRELAAHVVTASQRAAEASVGSITAAGALSAQTNTQLSQLLLALAERDQAGQAASAALIAAQSDLAQNLAGMDKFLLEIRKATTDVKAHVQSVAAMSEQARLAMETNARVAVESKESVRLLTSWSQQHEAQLLKYDMTLRNAAAVLDGLDTSLGKTLETLQRGLEAYNAQVEENLQKIVSVSNDHFGQAALGLRAFTEDLKESLDDLSDVIERLKS